MGAWIHDIDRYNYIGKLVAFAIKEEFRIELDAAEIEAIQWAILEQTLSASSRETEARRAG